MPIELKKRLENTTSLIDTCTPLDKHRCHLLVARVDSSVQRSAVVLIHRIDIFSFFNLRMDILQATEDHHRKIRHLRSG